MTSTPKLKMTTDLPASIMAPDHVETSIGSLDYTDGVPDETTVANVYDYLDRARAVESFLDCIPAMSMRSPIWTVKERTRKLLFRVQLHSVTTVASSSWSVHRPINHSSSFSCS